MQTTLLADSAPYDDQLWRFALSVVLGPRRQPQLIDFAELIEAGYLEQRDIDGVYLGSDPSNVDYGAIFGGRRQILDRAAERFAADKPADFDDFIQANEDWLIPYCEFMTVKEECGLKAFWEWPAELRTRGELPPRSAPTIRSVCSTTR